MSLVRTALRIATRKAIEGKTAALGLVRDSSIVTLEAALSEIPAPVVLIYTDDTMARPTGRDFWSPGTIDLTMVIAVAGAFKVEGENGQGETVEFRYPSTDGASELMIDVIERQIKAALADPRNPWSDVWKGLVTGVEFWNSTRGASAEKGNRFAARQIIARLNTVDDPVPGADPVGTWKLLLDQIDADTTEEWGTMPDLLRSLIRGGTISAATRDAMQQGLTFGQTRAIRQNRVTVEQDGDGWRTDGYVAIETDPGVSP